MPGYLSQYLAQLDPAMGMIPPQPPQPSVAPPAPVQLPEMQITAQVPGPEQTWQPPAPPGPAHTVPMPEEAPAALAEAFPGSPIGNFAANTLNGGLQPGLDQNGQMGGQSLVSASQTSQLPSQTSQSPDLQQLGQLTGDEKLQYGLSAAGDVADQLDRVFRRGKLSKWARLQGQDVAPSGLSQASQLLRQQIMQAPQERQQAAVQQYAMQRQADADRQQREALDPNSRISQQMQQGPMGQLLRQNGFDDRTIALVPAAHMGDVEQAVRAAAEARQAQANFDSEQRMRTAREGLQQQNWQQQFDRQGQQYDQGMAMDQARLGETSRHNRAMEQRGSMPDQRAMMLQQMASEALRSGDTQRLREIANMDPAGGLGKALMQRAEQMEQRNVNLDGATPSASATPQDIKAAKDVQALYGDAQANLQALQDALKNYSGWEKAGDTLGSLVNYKSDDRTAIDTRANLLMASLNALTGQGALGDQESARMKETFGSQDRLVSSFLDNPAKAAETLQDILTKGREARLRAYQFDVPSGGNPVDEYSQPASPAQTGMIRVRDPRTGEVRMHPASSRQAAINAGYEVY